MVGNHMGTIFVLNHICYWKNRKVIFRKLNMVEHKNMVPNHIFCSTIIVFCENRCYVFLG